MKKRKLAKKAKSKRFAYLESSLDERNATLSYWQRDCDKLSKITKDLRKQLRGQEIIIEQQRKELAEANAALQAYVRSYTAFKDRMEATRIEDLAGNRWYPAKEILELLH